MKINQLKVLSINPGATERIPEFSRVEESATGSIISFSDRVARIFGGRTALYLRGSGSRLLLRAVGALAIGGSAWMQLNGKISLFGPEMYSYESAIATIVLSVMMLLGITGRLAPLALAGMAVASLVSYAHANGGVADFSVTCQLSLIYGAMAAMVAVLGTGRFTLPCWIAGRIDKLSKKE